MDSPFTLYFFLTFLIGYTFKLLKEDDKPKVVVVLKELNTQYWNILKLGTEKGFRDFGIDGKVLATRGGFAEEQNRILETVLKEKPDVLIVSPLLSSNRPPETIIEVRPSYWYFFLTDYIKRTKDFWNLTLGIIMENGSSENW